MKKVWDKEPVVVIVPAKVPGQLPAVPVEAVAHAPKFVALRAAMQVPVFERGASRAAQGGKRHRGAARNHLPFRGQPAAPERFQQMACVP
mgnify:CR=1 FL=1